MEVRMNEFETQQQEEQAKSIAQIRLEALGKGKDEERRDPEPPVLSEKQIQEKKHDKMAIYMLLIGVIIVIMKLTIPVGIIYPEYQYDSSIIGEPQLYTLNLHYGAEATYLGQTYDELSEQMKSLVLSGDYYMDGLRWSNRIDLFNDFIGYVLMAYACFLLKKRRGRFFRFAGYCAAGSILTKLYIVTAPFYLTGSRLVWSVLCMGIANFFLMFSVVYFFIAGVCQCLDKVNFRQDRRVLLLLWFVMLIVQMIVGITSWMMIGSVTFLYNMILFFLLLGFLWKCVRLSEFIVREESVPDYSIKELFLNSDWYQRRALRRQQTDLRKNASREIKERRRKLEEARKRAEAESSERNIQYQDAGIKKIKRKDVIDQKGKRH